MSTKGSQYSHDRPEFRYGIDKLTPGLALDIARGKTKATISPQAVEKIEKSFANTKKLATSSRPIYGINTGFGPLCRTIISKEETKTLQYNLIRSHSCGTGELVSPEIVKLMIVTKIHSLCIGYSGVSLETLKRLQWHMENNIIPVIYTQGSVGASGDLVPLAHMILPLIGEGSVLFKGKIYPSMEILKRFNLKPIELHPKEGLALINGTQFTLALAITGISKLFNCLENADLISSITVDALKGSLQPFDERLHSLRPHAGSIHVARKIRVILSGSEILKSHENCEKVQDPYSIRCIPQVHGAAWDAFKHLKETLTIELNSVTDNPIIFDEQTAISGGNFHGEPIALPIDYATLSAIEIGNISDRRSYLLLAGDEELPPLLSKNPGLNSGFMIAQYTSAAISSENKTLGFPPSVDSVPTALGQEDHVSMGSISALKLNRITDNLSKILSVELLLSAQALDFRKPLRSSSIIEGCMEIIRDVIPHIEQDETLYRHIQTANKLINEGKLLEKASTLGLTVEGNEFRLY